MLVPGLVIIRLTGCSRSGRWWAVFVPSWRRGSVKRWTSSADWLSVWHVPALHAHGPRGKYTQAIISMSLMTAILNAKKTFEV